MTDLQDQVMDRMRTMFAPDAVEFDPRSLPDAQRHAHEMAVQLAQTALRVDDARLWNASTAALMLTGIAPPPEIAGCACERCWMDYSDDTWLEVRDAFVRAGASLVEEGLEPS